jgi:hypothetical protein
MAWPVVGPPSLRGFIAAGFLSLALAVGLFFCATPCAVEPVVVDVRVGQPLDDTLVVDVGDEAPILFECRFQGRYLSCR